MLALHLWTYAYNLIVVLVNKKKELKSWVLVRPNRYRSDADADFNI